MKSGKQVDEDLSVNKFTNNLNKPANSYRVIHDNVELTAKDFLQDQRRLKPYLISHFSVPELETLLASVTDALNQGKAFYEKEQEERRKHQEIVKEIASMLIDHSVGVNELESVLQNHTKLINVRNGASKRRAKYEYYFNGVRKTWTGQGRVPKPIQIQIDAGTKQLNDFLI